MVNKELEITKSLMTHIHIILGTEPTKEYTFSSLEELYNKISAAIDTPQSNETGYYGVELLDSFDNSMIWMKKRGIVIFEDDEKSKPSAIRIDKDKLIKYIIDPEPFEVNSSNTTGNTF